MTDNEKAIVKLLVALTGKVAAQSELQFGLLRVLSQLPIADDAARQSLRDSVARAETNHDQTQALLESVKALSSWL